MCVNDTVSLIKVVPEVMHGMSSTHVCEQSTIGRASEETLSEYTYSIMIKGQVAESTPSPFSVADTCSAQVAEELQTQGVLPLRSPHVGALHVVLVGSRPDHLGSDLIQIEERLRIGSMVCGNFGGASVKAIQTRKKLAALTAVASALEGADASVSTAHIFVGKQLEVRRVMCLNVHSSYHFPTWSLEG